MVVLFVHIGSWNCSLPFRLLSRDRGNKFLIWYVINGVGNYKNEIKILCVTCDMSQMSQCFGQRVLRLLVFNNYNDCVV